MYLLRGLHAKEEPTRIEETTLSLQRSVPKCSTGVFLVAVAAAAAAAKSAGANQRAPWNETSPLPPVAAAEQVADSLREGCSVEMGINGRGS